MSLEAAVPLSLPDRMSREDLIAEVKYWRGEAFDDDPLAVVLRNVFSNLRPIDARLLSVLYTAKGRALSVHFINDWLPEPKGSRSSASAIRVRIFLLRTKIGRDAIENHYGGYGLSPAGINLVSRAIG